MRETVEEYLARGGEITQIDRGVSSNTVRLQRHAKSRQRVVYANDKDRPTFNPSKKYK